MVTDEMVEKAAEAYWMEVYGRHRKENKWPDDVCGSSQGLFRDGCRAALEAALSTDAEPVANIVPQHCSGSAMVFEGGCLHVRKDGSGYIIVDEDDFALEDDRCEGESGPEGSVHWIARFPAGEMTELRNFLNGQRFATPPAPSVAVKALEWHKQAMSHSYGLFIRLARTSIGNYQVSHGASGKFEVYLDKEPISAAYDGVPEAKAAAQADYEARIRSALSSQVQDVATHRHKKRGTQYVLIGVGKMQVENWCEFTTEVNHAEGREYAFAGKAVDMREVAIYRSVDDGSLWVRPVEEFNDGRFEPLPSAPAKQ